MGKRGAGLKLRKKVYEAVTVYYIACIASYMQCMFESTYLTRLFSSHDKVTVQWISKFCVEPSLQWFATILQKNFFHAHMITAIKFEWEIWCMCENHENRCSNFFGKIAANHCNLTCY